LTEAANKFKELIRSMDGMSEIKGFITYSDDTKTVTSSQNQSDIVKKF
jgi:hypothetical protein